MLKPKMVKTTKTISVKMTPDQKVFHQAAGMASPHYKAPTPFKIVGDTFKTVAKSAGKLTTKVVSKIMAPEVNRLKIQDAKMKKMAREAKSGMYNR